MKKISIDSTRRNQKLLAFLCFLCHMVLILIRGQTLLPLFLYKLNHTFLFGGLSESSAFLSPSSSPSSSSSLCILVLWLVATGRFEHVEPADGGVGGPAVEGPGTILVSMAIR